MIRVPSNGRARAAMVAATLCGIALLVSACPKNVPQDSKSGEDAKPKGAKPLTLENNEGTARGIVTYPGGDRVDWKVIELPKDQTGALKLTLKWTPPRPGLDLSLNVLNEWNREVGSAKPNKRRNSRKTRKVITVEGAKGKYFIAVYASERGDAGKYTLAAEFAPNAVDTFDWLAVPISIRPSCRRCPSRSSRATPRPTTPRTRRARASAPSRPTRRTRPAPASARPRPTRPSRPASRPCRARPRRT